jgi:enolase-phosphatase E1
MYKADRRDDHVHFFRSRGSGQASFGFRSRGEHPRQFPYAQEHIEDFLQRKAATPEVQEAIEAIRQQADDDLQDVSNPFEAVKVPTEPHDDKLQAVLANVRQSMKRDRKVTGLKKLQGGSSEVLWPLIHASPTGLIWEEGYQSGQLKSQCVMRPLRPYSCRHRMYDDAIEAFERWTSQSYKLYIYSSGSIAAQKLLFGYTTAGDLTKVCSGLRLDEKLTREQYLSGYFDTTSGPKVDSQSYNTIAQSIGVQPSNVLFLTDNVKGRAHCISWLC